MMIIGCDFHPGGQQIAWSDGETGETRGAETGAASGDAKALTATCGAGADRHGGHGQQSVIHRTGPGLGA
jgi:hypothetical protein